VRSVNGLGKLNDGQQEGLSDGINGGGRRREVGEDVESGSEVDEGMERLKNKVDEVNRDKGEGN
ncbi:hypothetical protein, partial [Staphylococcus aureus]|uniref:hypothetical protein n=1 Tax=Staphylococcus aureus TaxID=1280 RepID=UPI001C9303E2